MTADSVWLKSRLRTDGSYGLQLCYGEEIFALGPDSATTYANYVMEAVVAAEYDAAVMHQLTSIGVDRTAAAEIVLDLRRQRPAGSRTSTESWGAGSAGNWGLGQFQSPLRIEGLVSERTGEGFIMCTWGDEEEAFSWSLADARQHALQVLEVSLGAKQDTLYKNLLTTRMNIDSDRAAQLVAELIDHR